MTAHEKQQIEQIKADLATLATRMMATAGGKPDLVAIVERNGQAEPAPYSVVGGGERKVP